jgi:predicted TIM-barrel fold metal-dependent hydrolase
MTYAPADRVFYDADSHIMELPDFLRAYADPALRDEVPLVSYSASLVTEEEVAVIVDNGNRHSVEHRQRMIDMGDSLIREVKEIQALGAFDRDDRTLAMDQLGFARQLVFATHSVAMPFNPSSRLEPRLRYGATRAHNRHMREFCANDSRLMGVAIVPLDDVDHALTELDWVLEGGFDAVWVPHRPCGDKSPGHVELEPFWARLAEAGLPGYETASWYGVVTPAGTPAPIVERLATELARIVRLPAMREQLLADGAVPVGSTPQAFGAHIKAELARWSKLVRDAKIKADS